MMDPGSPPHRRQLTPSSHPHHDEGRPVPPAAARLRPAGSGGDAASCQGFRANADEPGQEAASAAVLAVPASRAVEGGLE